MLDLRLDGKCSAVMSKNYNIKFWGFSTIMSFLDADLEQIHYCNTPYLKRNPLPPNVILDPNDKNSISTPADEKQQLYEAFNSLTYVGLSRGVLPRGLAPTERGWVLPKAPHLHHYNGHIQHHG